MACTARQERELKMKYEKEKRNAKTPLELLRAYCLARGVKGINALAKAFKRADEDNNHKLDIREFRQAIHCSGIQLSKENEEQLFNDMDRSGDGWINMDEFIIALRPPMNQRRLDLVMAAFRKLDKTGDNVITVEDLKGVYSGKCHPKYLSGEWTEEQVLQGFIDTFDTEGDGVISELEFENYYVGVSAAIDNDAYFDLMMRQAWKL